jgi:hypothetical protein
MANKSDWQEANRRLMAEQREALGEAPTPEELLAYSRGELNERDEERIRDLLVAYPELARTYSAPLPEEPQPGITEEEIAAGLYDVKQRLGISSPRRRIWYYLPTTVAASLALVFFGLYVQAESRARDHARTCDLPRILGAPQELDPDGNRGANPATVLRKDGEAYLLKPRLLNQVRYPHYSLELHDGRGPVWTASAAEAAQDDTFQIVIPHSFLRAGDTYQLRIAGIDGETRRPVGVYDVAVPAE